MIDLKNQPTSERYQESANSRRSIDRKPNSHILLKKNKKRKKRSIGKTKNQQKFWSRLRSSQVKNTKRNFKSPNILNRFSMEQVMTISSKLDDHQPDRGSIKDLKSNYQLARNKSLATFKYK